MADDKVSPEGAEAAADATAEQDPFAGFQAEEYDRGERVPEETPPAAEEVAPDEDEEQQQDTAESAKEEGEKPADPPKPKPKQTVQERINELTREKHEERRAREALEARLRDLEAQLTPPKEEKPEAAAAEVQGPPKPEDFAYGELDGGYIAALARYHADMRWAEILQAQQAEAQNEEAEARRAAANQKFTAQVTTAQEKYPDFQEKVVETAARGDWPLSQELGELIVDSDVGHHIAYHLATNPDEAVRVFRQTPTEQARYFGRMEAKFSAEQSAATGGEPAGKTAQPKAPQAPPPVIPARGAGGQFTAAADTDDFLAFERKANGQQ